jgi:hypothetical protein
MVVLFWTNRVIILPNQEHLYSFGFGHNFNQQEYRYSQLPEAKNDKSQIKVIKFATFSQFNPSNL